MGRRTSNLADLYIGVSKVTQIASITYDFPDRESIESDVLTDGPKEVLGVGAPNGPHAMEVVCELDNEDTNGQGALQAAYDTGALVENAAFYPDGRVTGAIEFTGSFYVRSCPRQGSAGNENKARKGTFNILWAAAPTKGTYSV